MEVKIIMGVLNLLARLPLLWMHRVGWMIGWLFILIPNRERLHAEINLRLCYPELTELDRRSLRDQSLVQAGRTFTEMAAVWFWPTERILGLIQSVSGAHHLQREPGQGLIVLAPHLGCWEIAGHYLASMGSTTILYRPPRKKAFDPIIKNARERSGAKLVPTNSHGVKQLYKALQSGGTTGILPDQEPDSSKGAVFAPFFAVPALTMLLVNRLVRKTGAKVVFCYAKRLAEGRGFHLYYMAAPDGMDAADPKLAASALNLGVEACVRELPDQYQWSYKRFKEQPAGHASPYRKVKSSNPN